MAPEDAVNTGVRNLDAVVAGEIPNDADRPEVVGLPQMENLLGNFRRRLVGGFLRNWLGIDEGRLTAGSIGRLPAVEAGSPDAKIAARPGDLTGLLRVTQDLQFPGNFLPVSVHRSILRAQTWDSTKDVSRVRSFLHRSMRQGIPNTQSPEKSRHHLKTGNSTTYKSRPADAKSKAYEIFTDD